MATVLGCGGMVAQPDAICQEKQAEVCRRWAVTGMGFLLVGRKVLHLLPDVSTGSSFNTDLLGANHFLPACHPCCHLPALVSRTLVEAEDISLSICFPTAKQKESPISV